MNPKTEMLFAEQGFKRITGATLHAREELHQVVIDGDGQADQCERQSVVLDHGLLANGSHQQDHGERVHRDPLEPAESTGDEVDHLGVDEGADGGHQGHGPCQPDGIAAEEGSRLRALDQSVDEQAGRGHEAENRQNGEEVAEDEDGLVGHVSWVVPTGFEPAFPA